jgi:hypothetical protein
MATLCLCVASCVVDVPVDDVACDPEDGLVCAPGWACVTGAEDETCRGPGVCRPLTVRSCLDGVDTSPLSLAGFEVVWRTPNQARLHWNTVDPGADADISHFELRVADDEPGLSSPTARVIDSDENPELGRSFRAGTGEDEPVEDTTVTGLEPTDRKVVRLIVFDTRGRASCSDVAPITDWVPPSTEVVLFDDELGPSAYPVCGDVRVDPAGARRGSSYLFREQRCHLETFDGETSRTGTCEGSPPAPPLESGTCWVNMFVRGLATRLDLVEGDLNAAYLELYVRASGSRDVFWAGVSLNRESAAMALGAPSFGFERLALRTDGEWHRFQVPLRHMRLGFADAAGEADCDPLYVGAFPDGIDGFRFGASFDVGAQISVDDVRIYW